MTSFINVYCAYNWSKYWLYQCSWKKGGAATRIRGVLFCFLILRMIVWLSQISGNVEDTMDSSKRKNTNNRHRLEQITTKSDSWTVIELNFKTRKTVLCSQPVSNVRIKHLGFIARFILFRESNEFPKNKWKHLSSKSRTNFLLMYWPTETGTERVHQTRSIEAEYSLNIHLNSSKRNQGRLYYSAQK